MVIFNGQKKSSGTKRDTRFIHSDGFKEKGHVTTSYVEKRKELVNFRQHTATKI